LANVTISDWEFTTENHKHGKQMALLDCTRTFWEFSFCGNFPNLVTQHGFLFSKMGYGMGDQTIGAQRWVVAQQN
jgi:hypothetical protein